MYSVTVGNLGCVHRSDDFQDAKIAFDNYVTLSKDGAGRCAGESVYLWDGDDIYEEYEGTTEY
jgi:hypothetical protein